MPEKIRLSDEEIRDLLQKELIMVHFSGGMTEVAATRWVLNLYSSADTCSEQIGWMFRDLFNKAIGDNVDELNKRWTKRVEARSRAQVALHKLAGMTEMAFPPWDDPPDEVKEAIRG